MIAFNPTGAIQSFTGANTAPTAVQAVSVNGANTQQFCLTNTDQNNDCVVAWGQTAAGAALNAVVASGSPNCYYLLARSQVIVTAADDAYFTGITPGSGVTAIIKVQPGYGL